MLFRSGLVVAPGDVPALARAIRRLLDNAEEASTLGRRARERCDARYSFRAARATLFPLIDSLAPRAGHTHRER